MPAFFRKDCNLKVDNNSDYTLIFSVSNHPFLGVLIEPYVVAYTSAKTLSLTYQKVFSGNSSHYSKLTPKEHSLIAMLDGIMVESIVKKFSPVQKIRPKEYFHKHFDKSLFKNTIRPYIEEHLIQLLASIKPEEIKLYLADEINPASQRITICSDFTKVLFHFRKNENGTSYFVTLKHNNEKVMFMKQNGLLISNKPAYITVNKHLYKFYDFVDGSKLGVFLNRKYIHIRPESEKHYYETYISSLLETAPVYAEGFEILSKKEEAVPCLTFAQKGEQFGFKLSLQYGDHLFDYKPNKQFHVHLNWNDNHPIFTKYKCSRIWESNKIAALNALDLKLLNEDFLVYKDAQLLNAIEWLRKNGDLIQASGFKIKTELDTVYSFATPKIKYNITDNIDWFDINIDVEIGEFTIPFKKIVAEIKRGNKEITLPNNEVFIFPEEWFTLSDALTNAKKSGNRFQIKKYQLDVLNLIKSKKIKDHLKNLVHIQEEKPSSQLKGTLRKYQLDGLSWLMFLKNNHFGGILADDMGLGKTIQTLAFLQLAKAKKVKNKPPFLLIAPTSLLFNWQQEIEKFTPNLSYTIHSGGRRVKDPAKFSKFDLVITTYGLIRNDFELFSEMDFDIIIIDESQNIKNYRSKTAQQINKLKASCRIALTGTPIENSIKDLWSQMNFLNPGLLGSLRQFEEVFVKPIEKIQERDKAIELQRITKPFILRRTKDEVAKELPPITEKVILCDMSKEQAKIYEEVKSEYRNSILKVVDEQGINKSKLSVLQGLTKLRQIANHPKLVDSEYKGSSGKHEMLLEHISTALEENHKVLVFSQYVTYIKIIEQELVAKGFSFLKLTGSTSKKARADYVNQFQSDESISVFLISLKAGGTGLNLTAADYVFLVDPWWNPAAEAQARDRTHRIGQANNVFSYKFISKDTVEEKIVKLQKRKESYSKDIITTENNILKNLDINDINILLS